jgi:hypothetical protein
MMKKLIVTAATLTTAAASVLVAAPAANADGQPTLGVVWAPYQDGYGTARPSRVPNGGDPTGIIASITWSSWGGAQATGTGVGFWHAPNATVADGTNAPATIVAWDLGPCNGKQVYRAVNWYFPSKGETLNKNQYINICTGAYVG